MKFPILLLVLLCGLTVFYRPVAKTAFGIFTQLVLRWQADCRFAYRAIEWQGKKVVFSDVALFDLSGERCSYQMHADKIEFSFDWSQFPRRLKGHLSVDRPCVSLFDPYHFPESSGNSWLSLTAIVKEGKVEWPGIERACFQFLKTAPEQLGRLDLDWGGAGVSFEAIREGKGLRMDGDFRKMPAQLLKNLAAFYFPALGYLEVQQGIVLGTIHLHIEEGRARSGSARLETERLSSSLGNWAVRNFNGKLDWEGPFELGKPERLLKDFCPASLDGRCRLSIEAGEFLSPTSGIENLAGEFSYSSGVGAKWELAGTGCLDQARHPFELRGRGYFPLQMPNWIETELQFGKSSLKAAGREGEARRTWSLRCADLLAGQVSFLQAIGAEFWPELASFGCASGVLNAEGSATFSEERLESWNVSQVDAKQVVFEWEGAQYSAQSLEGHLGVEGGKIGLAGGGFRFLLPGGTSFEGKGWSGQGIWEEGVLISSHFNGWVEGVQSALELAGTRQGWTAKGELAGLVSGSFFVKGSWEEQIHAEIETACVEGISFSGLGCSDGSGNFFVGIERFHGQIGSLSKIWPELTFGGKIRSVGQGLKLEGSRDGWNWQVEGEVEKGIVFKHANLRLENLSFSFEAGKNGFACYGIEGECASPQGKVSMRCPLILRQGSDWEFDFRLESESWDLIRLAGTSDEKQMAFDEKKCRLLGTPFSVSRCTLAGRSLEELDFQITLPWDSILAAGPFLERFGIESWAKTPLSGAADVQFRYKNEGGSELTVRGIGIRYKDQPLPLEITAHEELGEWSVGAHFLDKARLACTVWKEGDQFRVGQGAAEWDQVFKAEFEGRISPALRCEMHLAKASVFLSGAAPFAAKFGMPIVGLEGVLEGSGHLVANKGAEIDLDFTAADLKAGSLRLENKGPVHLFYSSDRGITFRGIDLHAESPSIECKVGLLHFDAFRSHWVFSHSHVHLPAEFAALLPKRPPFLKALGIEQELDFVADIECSSDFSHLSCAMKEGFIPFQGTVRHIQDLYLVLDENDLAAQFQTFHQGRLLRVGVQADLGPKSEGRVTLEDLEYPLTDDERPLSIDWTYGDKLEVRAIEGAFGGIDACFHSEEENRLIGSARIHFGVLSELLPPSAAEVFKELEMGKGYELKGRLFLGEGLRFQGLLSGKQLELFGYQFRTLLAQVDLGPEKLRIYDLKISDTAGILKCEEILIETPNNLPSTISIPRLAIQELRPSLLQKPGSSTPGEISPLVVRELKMTDFKGLLDVGKTWTAKGELNFINSYKREHTVLDLPADVLGRIVGLDLELLIPVTGSLNFDLKDGYFRLGDLKDSFSESNRSQFFLVQDENSPTMDLDGNLKILVKMKQFVLFKFTEAFLISIEGKLNDPKYHLQKKKRFLGM